MCTGYADEYDEQLAVRLSDKSVRRRYCEFSDYKKTEGVPFLERLQHQFDKCGPTPADGIGTTLHLLFQSPIKNF